MVIPWSQVAVVVGTVLLAAAMSVPVARYLPRLSSWRPRPTRARRRWLVPVAGAVVVRPDCSAARTRWTATNAASAARGWKRRCGRLEVANSVSVEGMTSFYLRMSFRRA